MKKISIKKHLKDYSIYKNRGTTINNAFASAISIADTYSEEKLNSALQILGQDIDGDLLCAYCDKPAETWDHVKALVVKGEFSGHGHTLNNLIPCCKQCNSKKGNKEWKQFLQEKSFHTPNRLKKIESYISEDKTDLLNILNTTCKDELDKLNKIKKQILELLNEGDKQAVLIRNKVKNSFGF